MKALPDRNERLRSFFEEMQDDICRLDATDPANVRLMERATKRARMGDSSLAMAAVDNFVAINTSIPGHYGCVKLRPDVILGAQLFLQHTLERYTKTLSPDSIQESLDMPCLLDMWRYGPGASYEVHGTHAAHKISQNMTTTKLCLPFVKKLRQFHPYFQAFDSLNGDCGCTVVNGSRLATVPKNQETDRTIAIEPSGNMCMQLAAGTYLEGALRMVGIDITNQQVKNKNLARLGSIDGSMATIDLKNASDLITVALIRVLLPRDWFILLMSIRSPRIDIGNEQWVDLKMVSTMGCGFTFPLMTLVLLSLIVGLRYEAGKSPKYVNLENTAVFGDDIIVPTSEYFPLCTVLEDAGLLVNNDKSYHVGDFRESCGGDYQKGRNITPFYVTSLDSESSVYVAINQTLDWCARERKLLPRSLNFLLSLLPERRLLVPEWENPDSGILTSQARRRYYKLQPDPQKKVLRGNALFFTMPLAVGGYITSFGDMASFVPRPKGRVRYKAVSARIPKGFLDGWAVEKYSLQESVHRSFILALLTNC